MGDAPCGSSPFLCETNGAAPAPRLRTRFPRRVSCAGKREKGWCALRRRHGRQSGKCRAGSPAREGGPRTRLRGKPFPLWKAGDRGSGRRFEPGLQRGGWAGLSCGKDHLPPRPGVPHMRPGPASSVCRSRRWGLRPCRSPFPKTRSAPPGGASAFLARCAAWAQRPFLAKNQKAAQPRRLSDRQHRALLLSAAPKHAAFARLHARGPSQPGSICRDRRKRKSAAERTGAIAICRNGRAKSPRGKSRLNVRVPPLRGGRSAFLQTCFQYSKGPQPRAQAARSPGGRHQKPAGAKVPHCAQAAPPMGAVPRLQPLHRRTRQRPPRGRAGFLFFQLNISAACSRPASVTSSAPSWPGWVSSTAQRISGCCRAR